MKFAIFLLVACLCVSFICAETREKTWGNVRARELGRERVVKITDEKRNTVTIKYPVIPNEDPIVGVKLIDRIPNTTVEFVEGNIGDKQLTLKLTAEEHDIDVTLIFYHEQQ